jgi:hypothetical protein
MCLCQDAISCGLHLRQSLIVVDPLLCPVRILTICASVNCDGFIDLPVAGMESGKFCTRFRRKGQMRSSMKPMAVTAPGCEPAGTERRSRNRGGTARDRKDEGCREHLAAPLKSQETYLPQIAA